MIALNRMDEVVGALQQKVLKRLVFECYDSKFYGPKQWEMFETLSLKKHGLSNPTPIGSFQKDAQKVRPFFGTTDV